MEKFTNINKREEFILETFNDPENEYNVMDFRNNLSCLSMSNPMSPEYGGKKIEITGTYLLVKADVFLLT